MSTQQAARETSNELLDELRQPSFYPDHPASVEVCETHISWVFLAGRYAYKLKKAVRFDFLDFSTCELRRQACEWELRLNRRLSPTVYRAVVPICRRKTGKLALGGNGEVVDWLVKMRRLDDRRTLQAILTKASDNHDLGDQLRSVATHLAKFYATQAPVTVRTSEYAENLRRHVDDNEQQLLQIELSDTDRDTVRRVHSIQKRFLATHREVFDDRVRDGRIVDGHGDLRPDHIYLYNQPLVIDCIEFNAEYRRNDIADELAFLAMECDRLGSPTMGTALFHAYARTSHDTPSDRLVAFYKTYRACVRAKVAALRSRQQGVASAIASLQTEHEYICLADGYRPRVGPRLVLMVGGLMGTGKSTLAGELGTALSAEVVSSDIVRQRLGAGTSRGTHSRSSTATHSRFGAGTYSYQARLETYRSMMAIAADAFAKNDTVILDATFSMATSRLLAAQLAESRDARLLQVECTCPRDIALERIANRLLGVSSSEAIPEFYDLQAAEAEPPSRSAPLIEVNTTLPFGRQVAVILEKVRTVID